MGKDGTVVVSKVAALLLAAIAIAMIRNGVLDIIHGVKLP
jgi:small neutral amino acid transporter SnatA (MarC family)